MCYRRGKGLGSTKSTKQDQWKGNTTVSQTRKSETKYEEKLRLIRLQKSEGTEKIEVDSTLLRHNEKCWYNNHYQVYRKDEASADSIGILLTARSKTMLRQV